VLKNPDLFQNGFHLSHYPLPKMIETLVRAENWDDLDGEFKKLTQQDGSLYLFLKKYHEFEVIEFIISIRDSKNEWEEDGIWHDDGSRSCAFSLSLTLEPDLLIGGRLGIRHKGEKNFLEISTPRFGGIIIFLTGIYGFEHKIHQVTSGKRVIIAGWCS